MPMRGTGIVARELSESLYNLQQLLMEPSMHELFARIAETCGDVLKRGGKIIFAGNGMAATTAQQCAYMLTHGVKAKRSGLAALALSVDGAVLSGVAAQEGFDKVFSRQIEAIGRPGDLFVAFSPSADEPNLLQALDKAKQRNMICVGFTGRDGKTMLALCDALIRVPSNSAPRVCEAHTVLATLLATLTETAYFNEKEWEEDAPTQKENVFSFREARESKENW
ncbi:MAG: SIS domain-containing protein [Rickettsiales bacterium]